MSLRHASYVIALGLTVLSFACIRGETEVKELRARAVDALLTQFETVFYESPQLVLSSGNYKRLPKDSTYALRVPFGNLLGGLGSLDEGAATEFLKSADGVFVGAKDFRPPAGLGDVQSRWCYVITLGDRTFRFNRAMEKYSAGSEADAVWIWTAKATEGRRTPLKIYATQVDDTHLLVSNTREDLGQVVQQLMSRREDLSSLRKMLDWEALNMREVWGYRRYRQTAAENKLAAGLSEVASATQALLVYADFDAMTAELRLTSPTSETAENFASKYGFPRFNEADRGVWTTSMPLSADSAPQRLITVAWLFGFGFYL